MIPHTSLTHAQPPRPHPAIVVSSPPSAPLSHFGQLAQAVAETLATRRDPRQLHPLMTPAAFECLQDNIGVYGWRTTPRLRRLRSLSPRPGALEVCAVVQCGGRVRALALRFEGVERAWLCCYLRTA
ncbi:hypothetical protein J4H86_04265 [Spiractinospora alimapuensis]|uniref:Rv3235 family protein n=1 Tax=Spiractinospora alimapuensis TaxID=2820884 RepID=UPI001F2895ED|nr:Rv3235 family protein [Spiractinospora alimapuensis]QVQ53026.1 hypothetical protein J4H86_04265 [Spiractinospora alimapuensis]